MSSNHRQTRHVPFRGEAHELAALRLKKWAIRMAVHHFKELALRWPGGSAGILGTPEGSMVFWDVFGGIWVETKGFLRLILEKR